MPVFAADDFVAAAGAYTYNSTINGRVGTVGAGAWNDVYFGDSSGSVGASLTSTTNNNSAPSDSVGSAQPSGKGYPNPNDIVNMTVPPSPDYSVSAKIISTIGSGASTGVLGRCTPTGGSKPITGQVTNGYAAFYDGTNTIYLYSYVSGSVASLGSIVQPVAANDILTLDMVGTTIRVLLNAVQKISVTNAAVTAANYAGLRLTGNFSTRQLTNFSAVSAGSGGGLSMVVG